MRVIVVGGGVLGTMHAWQAVRRGHEVVQLEREPQARGASVRNFGLVWVGGRAPGVELDTALRARALWEEIGDRVPALGFRTGGSLTVVRTAAELAVAKAAAEAPEAAARGHRLLDTKQALALNPALRGLTDGTLGALWCERDAAVEPRTAQRALQDHLRTTGRYTFLGGREIRAVDGPSVTDDHGERHSGDCVVLCPGDRVGGLVRELAPELPVRRVRLQMMQTAPLDERLTTSVADADSFRYYPAYHSDELDRVQPQPPVAAEHHMQLLMVQRADGSLTVGDTHEYEQPFGFDVDERPYEHLAAVATALLGRPLPPVRRRWAGVYAQCLDPTRLVARHRLDRGTLVTGPGGRGMTCSPAIAEDTAKELNW
ncbi:TIGR03364 family FAD-dependent oxidoreductase [Streptomyces alkaliterrae]|uniref:TIGR03364 family FAD-dependent oxidoreductase n=1 Tax=Streptomyces alkaliterrae TaxID=2213162 RepID=A0A5P0YT39_9ACTN|nr:TIGR03364 family FAD-dependent oxidoreductase [Streptomyces alkaliterrae]MBB1261007.1 TIGR03364 family FAD-dependent oxidoreductase [Streptomyces alkaliterrae]MQS02787.1 TIGR03364 family FAD-dependent oxidoreductase [Streptomyces alkaliterrae]